METIEQAYNKILTDENLMESITHGTNRYPFDFFYDDLALFDFNCIEWHWHTELEFVYVESGTVTFGVERNILSFQKEMECSLTRKFCIDFILLMGQLFPIFYACLVSFLLKTV